MSGALIGKPARTTPAPPRRARPEAQSAALPWLLGLAAAVLLLPFVSAHTIFRDEAATVYAMTLPWSALSDLLRVTDGIFTLYYGLLHVLGFLGPPLIVARVVSALAFGATVAIAALLGRYAGGRRGVWVAAGVTAVNPLLVREALDARPYMLATAVATGAVYLLLTASAHPGRRRLWGSAALTVLATYLHLFALLAPAWVALALTARAIRGRRSAPARASHRTGLSASRLSAVAPAAAALVAVTPLVPLGARQSAQVSWIPRMGARSAFDLLTAPALNLTLATPDRPRALAVIAAVLLAVACVGVWAFEAWRSAPATDPGSVPATSPRAVPATGPGAVPAAGATRSREAAGLALTALAWLFGPALTLAVISLKSPLTVSNYVTFSAPAVGLLAALAVRTVGRIQGHSARRVRVHAALTTYAVLGLLASTIAVATSPYEDDFRGAAGHLDRAARASDVVVYPSAMTRTGMRTYTTTRAVVWPDSGENDLQRWDVDESWRPPAGATIWVADYLNAFDEAGLTRFTDRLTQAGYVAGEKREFGTITVRAYMPTPGQ